MKRQIITLAIVLVMAAIAYVALRDAEVLQPSESRVASDVDPVAGSTRPEAVPASESGISSRRWVTALRQSDAVAFAGATGADDRSDLVVRPLPGPLDPVEKRRLLDRFDAAVLSLSLQFDQTRARVDPTQEDDLLGEAAAHHSLEIYRAARAVIENDHYVLVEEGQSFVREIPDGMVMTSNMVTHQGRRADAVLYLRFDDHPGWRAAAENLRQIERYWGSCKALAFNALPLSERMARLVAHESVTERLRNVPADVANDPEALEVWQSAIFRDRLPVGIVVDPVRFLARYAESRR